MSIVEGADCGAGHLRHLLHGWPSRKDMLPLIAPSVQVDVITEMLDLRQFLSQINGSASEGHSVLDRPFAADEGLDAVVGCGRYVVAHGSMISLGGFVVL